MKPIRKGRGFVMASAIFLLVILSALGAFLLNVSFVQKITSAQDFQGSRAYWMATAGVQWVASAINTASACATVFSYQLLLDGFTISVSCTKNTYTEGTTTFNVYWLTSTATIGGQSGNMGYAERVIGSFDY